MDKIKKSYLFKIFSPNQMSLEFSSISIMRMTTSETLLLLVIVMTILRIWTRDKYLQQKMKLVVRS